MIKLKLFLYAVIVFVLILFFHLLEKIGLIDLSRSLNFLGLVSADSTPDLPQAVKKYKQKGQ